MMGVVTILAAGIIAQWVAWRLRIPAIVVLLLTGLALGPGLGILDIDELLGHNLEIIVGLSVAVILFEGGLNLKFRDIRDHGPVVARLVTAGVAVTAIVGTVAAATLLDMSWDMALLLGTLLTVSGPTVVLPLLLHVRADKKTTAILRWEGILVDPVGAVLAVLVFEALLAGGGALGLELAGLGLVRAVFFGGGIGLAMGYGVASLERRYLIPDALGAGAGLASVLVAYALSDWLQPESGLVAVTVMGIYLANQKRADMRHLLDFKEDLSQILLGILFIILAARITRADIASLDGWAWLFVAVLVFVARPLATLASTWGSELSIRQRVFLAWMAPRGIVAAAVSAFFALRLEAAGHPEGAVLVPITFLTILATVVLYAVTSRPLARMLGIAGPSAKGILIIGANALARAVARPIHKAGIPVMLVDTNSEAVAAANMEDLPAVRADALDPYFEERHGVEGLGAMWALTPNRTTNALAAVRFTDDFGRADVYQVRVADDTGIDAHLRGRYLWDATYRRLRDRLREGWRIAKTPITEVFTLDSWKAEHPDAIPLYLITRGRIHVYAEDGSLDVEAGDTLVSLTRPEGTSSPSPQRPHPAS